MKFFVKNVNKSLRFCLNVLKFYGFLIPKSNSSLIEILLTIYKIIWFIFLIGIYIIVQTGELIQVWGNLTLMTSSTFLLFTNLALGIKIVNVVLRRRQILAIIEETDEELSTEGREAGKEIVKSFNRQTTRLLYLYIWLSAVTVFGWAASAEKNELPLRAWYPYDTSKSPAYELTYIHQSVALTMAALVNICSDTLVTSLVALCCCRLRLLSLSLRTLCQDCRINTKQLLSAEDEATVSSRLRTCVMQHKAALEAAALIQTCFTESILVQFTVSMFIICITAYQLAFETNNLVRFTSMMAYLLDMMLQVFLYCFQGNQLMEQSSQVGGAAYECPWYVFPVRVRRALLVVMVRSRRVANLTAGGFTILSLGCFMSIIKASYTFFTVLQRVEDKK